MQLPNTFYFPYELRECKGYGIWNFDKGYFSSKTFPSFRSAKLNNLRFITHTHRRGRLTFNQGESWSQFSLYPAPPVPPALRPCHAHPATGALIGFSLLRPQNKKEKWLENKKKWKEKGGENSRKENCNFRQASVALVSIRILRPSPTSFFWLLYHPSRTENCYSSVTKFTFHTFITSGSCN